MHFPLAPTPLPEGEGFLALLPREKDWDEGNEFGKPTSA